MKKILDLITSEVKEAFAACGYDESFAKVTLSNRPDLCEYQCNGAMAAAKAYRRNRSTLRTKLWRSWLAAICFQK